jgi:uncharacterized protein (DUF2252 family)
VSTPATVRRSRSTARPKAPARRRSAPSVTPSASAGAAPKKIAHLTAEQRAARGKAARNEVSRATHGQWEPAGNRPDPVSLLEEQAVTRVPELVPIRYGRMLVSPFTFYRGAALIMASDLAPSPRSGLNVQLCGDAHLSNFGVFASPERQMMFDINDFDETNPGPWEWDVKRLAASFEIAGRDRGYAPADRRAIVMSGVREYRERIRQAATMSNLDVWYAHIEITKLFDEVRSQIGKQQAKTAEANIAKARTKDSMQAFSKLTAEVDGERRITGDPPLIVPIDQLMPPGTEREATVNSLRSLLRAYRRTLETDRRHLLEDFRVVDMARKVVGVGSVGTRAWILLMLGRDDQDPLFLQAKEAEASVLERFVGKSAYPNHGQRVVAGQRLMQAASDIFLGWQRVTGIDGVVRDFYIRQLRDWKGSAVIETMQVSGMNAYARLCGAALARAHARSGDRIALASYLGKGDTFDKAIADFSVSYADQNERDYLAITQAVKSGRLTAETGL